MSYLAYFDRVIYAYFLKRDSQLCFWHGQPEINLNAFVKENKEYYMTFFDKANYQGPFDKRGIPLLNYYGKIGKQYNPIAIAQYALGHYNLYFNTKRNCHLDVFLKQADWLVENIKGNEFGVPVWLHNFDWEYKEILRNPWYSGLAQGIGISVLVRAYNTTKDGKYLDTADKAYLAFENDINKGGVIHWDKKGSPWIEEYILSPPTHILNGFIWALWGVYDYLLLLKEKNARKLWDNCLETLKKNLEKFDIGYWSLYDLSQTKIKNLASPFYHKLHIVQLEVLYRLSKIEIFKEFSQKWERYLNFKFNRSRAYFNKAIFKLLYF